MLSEALSMMQDHLWIVLLLGIFSVLYYQRILQTNFQHKDYKLR